MVAAILNLSAIETTYMLNNEKINNHLFLEGCGRWIPFSVFQERISTTRKIIGKKLENLLTAQTIKLKRFTVEFPLNVLLLDTQFHPSYKLLR